MVSIREELSQSSQSRLEGCRIVRLPCGVKHQLRSHVFVFRLPSLWLPYGSFRQELMKCVVDFRRSTNAPKGQSEAKPAKRGPQGPDIYKTVEKESIRNRFQLKKPGKCPWPGGKGKSWERKRRSNVQPGLPSSML